MIFDEEGMQFNAPKAADRRVESRLPRKGVLANTACFSIEGYEDQESTLKFRAYFKGATDFVSDKARFNRVAQVRLERIIARDYESYRAVVLCAENVFLTDHTTQIPWEKRSVFQPSWLCTALYPVLRQLHRLAMG